MTIPQLPAIRLDDGTYKVWCRYCDKWHFHGCIGVKVAHCRALDGYRSYELVESEETTT